MDFEVQCIDSSNRPNEIPLSIWNLLIVGKSYNVINIEKCNIQGGLIGYQLEEIDLKGCEPYLFFSAHRFIPLQPPQEIEEEELEELTI